MKEKQRGICKLCLLEKDLQRSHLMAKSLYKKSGSDDPKQPHPLVGTKAGTRPSSYQVQDYVFCRDCEQRFGKEGEDYMMRLVVTREQRFPLLEMLESTGAGLKGSFWTAYSVSDAPFVNRDKIGYFVASVFWRASVHQWKQDDGKIIFLDLGPENNETLRRYLLGETTFPPNAWIFAIACKDAESQTMFVMPGPNVKKDKTWAVIMRGLIFFFSMGTDAPGYIVRRCMMNSAERWITVRDCSKPHKIWQFA
jgi:hypothetical protein